jgi:predicted unusual protein kinase regulating ubiquinone biosynthesis (AarF/ABC1/UbiB family)
VSKLVTSRVGRFARLAALGTRAGAGQLASMLGSTEAQAKVASAAVEVLGSMRGLALKVGQMASYVDGFVPEEHRETYEGALRSLRAAAPTMTPEAAARVIQRELGASPEALFARWDARPFAAASIGEVHRAALGDGREVAVKVQYEGIAHAVKADLANASLLTALTRPLGSKFAAKEQIAELRARFEEELDYEHEARAGQRFAAIFRGHERIRVPEVISERCARAVLTTTLAEGLDFEAACAASEPERRAWAETLWRFVFTSLLAHGLFNADPHPGNYLFAEGGAVCFLDFGCTREVERHRMPDLRGAHRAAAARRDDEFVDHACSMLDMPRAGEARRLAREYLLLCFEPIRAGAPYRITHAFARALWEGMMQNARTMALSTSRDFAPLPAEWLFFNRLQLGFYSVLARLDVAVDYTAIEREILASVGVG